MPPRTTITPLLSSCLRQAAPSTRTVPSRAQRRGIKSILKPPPKPSRFDQSAQNGQPSALSASKVLERKSYTIPHRTGLIAVKKGHISVYDPESGKRMPATVLQIDRCQVISHKTMDKHGYWAVQVGCGYRQPRNLTRPERGHLAKYQIAPKEEIMEFRVKDARGVEVKVGAELKPDWFAIGQFVDCRSRNKGKGFAGVMKRHGFGGQPASHGQSLAHRIPGSTGGSQGSGSRVIPGKKMPGRMGGELHTVQNLRVLMTDTEKGILVVKGLVSGPRNSHVKVYDSKKMPWQVNDFGLSMGENLSVPRQPGVKEAITELLSAKTTEATLQA